MSGGGSTTFGKGKSSSSSSVRIPRYLRPLIEQGVTTGTGTIQNLENLLSTDTDTVADFNPIQQLSQILGVDRALGGGEFIPAAQQTFLDAAQGTNLSKYIPRSVLRTLSSPNSERDMGFYDESQELLRGLTDENGNISPSALQALEDTAGGKYLYGGEGFDAAVNAAVRAATPAILSAYGAAGSGGGTGALAKTAIGKAGIDAVASQYGQERGRMNAAAEILANLGLAERGQSADIAGLMADIGFNRAGLEQADDAMKMDGNALLSALYGAERDRQMSAASALPGIALADVNILDLIGGNIQDQEQRELMAPIANQLQLLQAALGATPIESLLGSKTNNKSRSFTQSLWAQGGM